LLLAGSIVAAGPRGASAAGPVPGDPDAAFASLVEAYVQDYLAAHPVRASQLGIHAHDARLPDLSRKAIRRRARELAAWLEALGAIARETLDPELRFDHEILEHAILAEQLELEEVRGWQRDPMGYNRVLAEAVSSLVDRRFAPLDERLRSLAARLQRFPQLIAAGRTNLRDVPALWAEIALRDTRGTRHYLAESVDAALREQGLERADPRIVAGYARARDGALQQLDRFVDWLEQVLVPRANGDWRLGRELFLRKLQFEEHVETTAEELARLNDESIASYRDKVEREVARIDGAATPAAVMEAVAGDHPPAGELIATARRYVEQARTFVVERKILTLPTDELPLVRPTPEYARSGFASMSAPGPFEEHATEAYYYITEVEPSWSPEQQAQHLTYFNHAGLLGISVHETMPGHYVQLLYQRQVPSAVRKIFAPRTLTEGWAHYVEQMMVDEGLGDGDQKIRLGQLRRALQRHARWYVSLALHVDGAPIEEVAGRFAEIAYFAPFPALRETQRGTYDPTYLYYALGRMQILALREDYRRWCAARGRPFSLLEFHDTFLRLGLPVSLARRAMMPD
jgi:uncharacterized protein (DUF885 family)